MAENEWKHELVRWSANFYVNKQTNKQEMTKAKKETNEMIIRISFECSEINEYMFESQKIDRKRSERKSTLIILE